MIELLQDLLTPSGDVGTWPGAFARLGQSCALGLVVAGLYRASVSRRDGAPGLTGTLIMLTMLITMVTISVQDTPAAAFALFGTLAIVRFRTRVRDIRDTAFVIFAVVVGLAVGALNAPIAFAGTVAIGLITFVITRIESNETSTALAHLTIRTTGLEYDKAALTATLSKFASKLKLTDARTNRSGDAMRLAYDIRPKDPNDIANLVQALTALPEVANARVTLS